MTEAAAESPSASKGNLSLPPVIIAPDHPEPDLPLLHDRVYSVRSYRRSATEMLIRGQIQDQKPAGLYFDGDPDPLAVHHMVLDLVVGFPTMEITEVSLIMETHPHAGCRSIEPHYESLVGVSIARGFNRRIRELFGGPRGCTHTSALLQAMAPVAIQSVWSMVGRSDEGTPVPPPLPSKPTMEQIRERFAFSLNTCHVWDEEGDLVASIADGGEMEPPLWAQERAEALGLDPDRWSEHRRK